MILTVDIGNTNVVAGGFAGEEPSFVDRLPSSREWDGTAWREALGELLRERGLTVDKIAGSALCSVVPELTERLRSALREVTRRPVRTAVSYTHLDVYKRQPMARAAAAMGEGSGPVVVSPSVNMTMTRLFVEVLSSAVAWVNAAP